jgi:hypothetical protein
MPETRTSTRRAPRTNRAWLAVVARLVASATLLINGQTVQAPPSNGIVAVKKSPPCAICENFVQHTASNSQGANTPNSSAQTLFGQFKSTTAAVPWMSIQSPLNASGSCPQRPSKRL